MEICWLSQECDERGGNRFQWPVVLPDSLIYAMTVGLMGFPLERTTFTIMGRNPSEQHRRIDPMSRLNPDSR